jgi:hypothetical protein
MTTSQCGHLVTTHSLLAYQEGLLLQNGASLVGPGRPSQVRRRFLMRQSGDNGSALHRASTNASPESVLPILPKLPTKQLFLT